jgi:hypothetical protein
MVSFRPLQQHGFYTYNQSSPNTAWERGWGEGRLKQFNGLESINCKSINLFIGYTIIYNIKKCNAIDSKYDNHAARLMPCEAH